MLKESIKEKLEMNVQKFIETLWDLSYGDTRRPQKDTCYDIKENEEGNYLKRDRRCFLFIFYLI